MGDKEMRDAAAMDEVTHGYEISVCIVGLMGHVGTLAPLATQKVLDTATTLLLKIVLMVVQNLSLICDG